MWLERICVCDESDVVIYQSRAAGCDTGSVSGFAVA